METARQHTEVGQFDDRRIDQVTRELERYQLCVLCKKPSGLVKQCIKWGKALCWQLAVQHHQLRSLDRGEGVAIVLSGPAVKAWRAGGEQWKAWSSRPVTGTLQPLQPEKANSDRIHILSCYAPTFSASRTD